MDLRRKRKKKHERNRTAYAYAISYFYVTHNQSLLWEWNIYHNSNQLQMSWIQNMEKIIIC